MRPGWLNCRGSVWVLSSAPAPCSGSAGAGLALPHLERGAAGQLGAVAALGGHAGVAGADEHGGADVQRGALGVHHAVQRVEGRGERELPQALPPRLGRLGQRRGLRRGLGRAQGRGPGRGGPVALGGLQELLGRAGLQETTGGTGGSGVSAGAAPDARLPSPGSRARVVLPLPG